MLSTTTSFHIGKLFFTIALIGLAIIGILAQDFIVSRPPAWNWGAKEILPLILNAIVILLCIAILLNKMANKAAIALALIIFIINFLLRHLPAMVKMDIQTLLLSNGYKALMFAGGAIILAIANSGKGSNKIWLIISAAAFSLFFIISGRNHFKYDAFVNDFIPKYIPFHSFWTYFCGVALIAGGIGLLIKPVRTWAALLSAIMVLIWFLLLHIPRFFMNMKDPSDQMGLFESLAFSGALFMMYSVFKNNDDKQITK